MDVPRQTIELADGAVLLEHDLGIRTQDGIRLSCDVYRPSKPGRYPGILEHIPYRKDDLDAADDRANGIYFAERGLASVRLDVRGSGNSEGVALDEYTEEEQRDGVEVVGWIAERSWCNGKVGSWGVSYGGFACIQLAALQPPALGAIAPVYATDDRYTDDMHFSGGALCALELAHYPMRILAMNALPPLRDTGEGDDEFRDRWLARVKATPPWIIRWMEEEHDGPYWRNGSLRPDPSRIRVPAMIVAGWRDGYRTTMLRLASSISTEWQLLAGPWMHAPPDRGIPGPRYPFMAELVQWFHRHLDGGLPADAGRRRPRTVFFLTEFDSPARPPATVSGRWLGSERWPDEPGATTTWHLSPHARLSDAPPTEAVRVTVPFGPSVGTASGNWCPPPPAHGLPADQRADDARSAAFTSAPLEEAVEVLGAPVASLRVEHPGPSAIVSVKLSDVSSEGEAQLVTSGVLNLSHRNGHERPEPFRGTENVRIELQATGWRFLEGHRIRVSVAGSDWPTVWPLPTTDPLVLLMGPDGACRVELPGTPPDAEPYEPAGEIRESSDRAGWEWRSGPSTWEIVTDTLAGTSGIRASDAWSVRSPNRELRAKESRRYQAFISEADPLGADVEGEATFRLDRPDVSVRSTARGRFRATEEEFLYDIRLDVREGGGIVHRDRWRGSVPRRLC